MKDHGSARWGLLGATVALTAGALAIVPGVTNTADEPIDAAGSVVVPSGTITIDGTDVSYSESALVQTLGNGQGCTLDATPADNLLRFDGGSKAVGLFDGGIGVKSKGNGQDCGQIDGTEMLTIDLGTAMELDEQAIYQADLDIEVLQDAGVTATAYFVDGTDALQVGSFRLLSGSLIPSPLPPGAVVSNTPDSTTAVPEAYCSPQSSSGPNAAEADNCFWTIISDTPFNRLVLTENSDDTGKASLQGGGDWPSSGPGGPTVFYLTETFDGILDCGDTIATGDATLGGVITRLGDPEDPACLLKPYNFQIDGSVVEFEPQGAPGASYKGEITKSIVQPVPPTTTSVPPTPPPAPLTWLEYDRDGDGPLGFVPMQWCANNSLDDTTLTNVIDTDGQPASWCIYAVDLSDPIVGAPLAPDTVTATYFVYGEDDPHWR